MTFFEPHDYALLLAVAKAGGLTRVPFDPALHPRNANGRFASVELTDDLLSSGFGPTKGVPSDTQDLHTERVNGKWGYTPERQRLHAAIVAKALDGAAKGKTATFTMGSPGAGKSYVVEQGGIASPNAVRVDVDEVRVQLPEYDVIKAEGDRRADELTQMEASDVADQILNAALDGGHEIVYDGLGTSARYFQRLDRVLDEGYKTKLVVVTVPTETAIQRVDERFHKTGRRTSYYLTKDASRRVAAEFPQLLKDYGPETHIEIWDNSDATPVRIAHTTDRGTLKADDYDAVKAFLRKSKEPPPERKPPPKPAGKAKAPATASGHVTVKRTKR